MSALRIASDESAARIDAFYSELVQLCAKHEVSLCPTDNVCEIEDNRRPDNVDWPTVASFESNADGLLEFSEIHEEDFPDDFAALKAAHAEGRPW